MLLFAVGVNYWEDLVGRKVRVRGTDRLKAIGHPENDTWYDIALHSENCSYEKAYDHTPVGM
jgi:hypothetical protein